MRVLSAAFKILQRATYLLLKILLLQRYYFFYRSIDRVSGTQGVNTMDKFLGPQDIYKKLVEDVPEDDEWLLGLVAFAIIEEQKIEWVGHQTEYNDAPPSQYDIDKWYKQLPEGMLLRAKDTAEARLTSYAQDAINAYMIDFEKETEEGIIVGEIREIKKFWPQFGVNLAGGFASALLFAIALTIMAFFIYNDTSPVDIGVELGAKLGRDGGEHDVGGN